MFVRLVYESFVRQKRRKVLAGAAITLGVTVATAMMASPASATKLTANFVPSAPTWLSLLRRHADVEIGGVNLKPPSDGAFLSKPISQSQSTFWHNNIWASRPCCRLRFDHTRKETGCHPAGYLFRQTMHSAKTSSRRACAPRIRGGRWRVAGGRSATS
jgi:putative ABC transport system permease protein